MSSMKKYLHHGQGALFLRRGQLRIIHTQHDIRQLKQPLALVQGHAHELANGNERQLAGDVLNKFTLSTLDCPVENFTGDLAKARLVAVDHLGGKRIAHQAPVLEMIRRIHIDQLQAHQRQHLLIGLVQHAGLLG
jgi:hypothetical protein